MESALAAAEVAKVEAPRRLRGSSPALRLLAGSAAPRRLCGSSPALQLLAGSAAPCRLWRLSLALLFYMHLSLALLLPRSRRASRWSSLPAPRRARAPAASTPHAHVAVARFGRPFSGRSFFLLASRCAGRSFFLLASLLALALRRAPRLPANKNTLASAHTDDRRTNDATCGPQAWLTGSLHEGGIRSVRSPPRRAPLLATPIAKPLQCGRP